MPFRLSIRSKLAFALLALTVLTVGISVALTVNRLSLYINDQAIDELLDDRQSVQLIIRLHQKDSRADAAALALRGDLQRAVAEGDHQAIQRIIEQYMRQQGSDTITITDANGTVLARAHAPDHYGDDVTSRSVVAWSLEGQTVETLDYVEGGPIYALGGVPIIDSDESQALLGTIIVGQALDQAFVADLKQSTGEDVSLIVNNRRIYTTLDAGSGRGDITRTDITEHSTISINGHAYHAVYGPLRGQSAVESVGVFGGPGERQVSAQRSAHNGAEADDAQLLEQQALHPDHIRHGDQREIGAVRPPRCRIDGVGPGRAAATAQEVWADDEILVGVDRLAGSHGDIPPA